MGSGLGLRLRFTSGVLKDCGGDTGLDRGLGFKFW